MKSYPFVVFVQLPDRRHCTGSIIAPKWILTAAHCLATSSGKWDNVRVFHGYGADYELSFRDSNRIILHPDYRYEFKDQPHRPNDIALIKLSTPFPASFTNSLGIPSQSAEKIYAPSGTSAVTVGYGNTATGASGRMRSVRENMYHARDCRDRLDIKNEAQAAHDDTICSGTATRRAHYGDSGSPLIVAYPENGITRWLQVGVANRHAMTPEDAIVSIIYAKVTSYLKWIRTTTKGAVSFIAAPDLDDPEEITTRIDDIKEQIRAMQTTVQSLQSNKALLKQRIDEFKDVEGQDKKLQTTEDEILSSVSAILPQ